MEFENMLQQGATIDDVKTFARSIIEGERNRIATLANISALLNQYLSQINWVGFYLLIPWTDSLVLGPFQGLVACTRIAVGQGVVGQCAKLHQTIVVPNVFEFPGHIACDSQSRSEIVVPIHSAQQMVGVLDVDSPEFDRFHEPEQEVLETVAQLLGENWTQMTQN
ncbi:GAF domain-containing protein [Sulfobacillus thermosulfidooxidans]|uniref:GAF domain-containing protein n=1 Tax=Sulfobacillus thermosulfidooxidans TaxID=28034 RepID=UPI0004291258|nr:GAF domain-containing protein [Sulfobacillus thermosulfidooxidans]